MEKEYRIVIRTSERKYKWLPKAFENCDIDPQYFRDDSKLDKVWKSDYELIGECGEAVEVSDLYGIIGYFKPLIFVKSR